MDLSDYLAWRACGSLARSRCTVSCKWTYNGGLAKVRLDSSQEIASTGWDEGFFMDIGLGDLVDEGFRRVGTDIAELGSSVGPLSEAIARTMGLEPGIIVSCPVVDAHAGGLGLLAAQPDSVKGTPIEFSKRLAILAGTSGCHMAVSQENTRVPGVWGPYYSSLIPSLWLHEGGQSSFGSLIDHVVLTHSAAAHVAQKARLTERRDILEEVFQVLNVEISRLAELSGAPTCQLTSNVHCLPYFLGNRSPRADPTLTGTMTGLSLHSPDSVTHLALSYYAALQALCYGTRHIIETMNEHEYSIQCLLASGGITANPLFVKELSDITGCAVAVCPAQAMFVGTAVLSSVAAGVHGSVPDAMRRMNTISSVHYPCHGTKAYHDRKYRVFLAMYNHAMEYRAIMQGT